jgi:hypothetical protein
MSVGESIVNAAGVPLKVTAIVPVKSVPRMPMIPPVLLEWGSVFTKRAKP